MTPLVRSLMVAVLCGASMLAAQAQSVSAALTVTTYSPICAISAASSLSYGSWYRPLSAGSGGVTVSTTTGSVTTSGGVESAGGSAHRASFTVTATHAASVNVSVSPPSSLSGPGGSLSHSVPFMQWRNSTTNSWSGSSSLTASPTPPGQRATRTSYYRLGGTVSGITTTTPLGTYTGTMTISVSCA